MSFPLLALPVQQLRTMQHAEQKNTEMMRRLYACDWFLDYRERLRRYRNGQAKRPVYPDARVEQVERAVDEWMRERYPDYTR